ncbi:NAD(P)-dependent oxidoreductase [Streptantibioticus rubrisoli]|uniref:D-isomer specific 2-hydroxyacid dehydrogenase NAD-binding domain-containing protein n=1 Tax=Streptantibioticus rubrisoli TaxID=1387313 RepID=A0ABT1P921_9ACTN|nr:NAD(P)-dependent oxidoreductase [Streptantibioticus rubrisoli]MCQ4041856.1 hypothetical protein [Streptantibioticus rubrisoli]
MSQTKPPKGRTVGVLGMGAVGRAVAARLTASGFPVVAGDQEDESRVLDAADGLLVTALTHGTQTHAVLAGGGVRCAEMLDLTTHSPHSAARCRQTAEARGIRYHGGGLTGGARQVGEGTAVLLVGPEPTEGVLTTCQVLGTVLTFGSAEQGALAKLLHNWVLIVQQWAVATALAEADAQGLTGLVDVLASGTAGRPVPEWSTVRDWDADQPASTYLSRLVAKDLRELRVSAPVVRDAGAAVMDQFDRVFSAEDDRPYTAALAVHLARASAVSADGDQGPS